MLNLPVNQQNSSEEKVKVAGSLASRIDLVFVIAMVVLASFFLVGIIINPQGEQLNVFFHRTEDFLADYFNVAKMAVNGNPYMYGLIDPTPQEHAYPPFSYLIFFFLARFADYAHLDAFEAGFSTTGLVSAFYIFAVGSFVFFILLYDLCNKNKVYKFLFCLLLAFSGIFIFSLERGNLVLLAAIFLSFFVVNFKSENKIIKELALISLALATALKGYPAILGLLLLHDRQYKEAIRAAIYGVGLVFLPFLFFEGGLANLPLWIQNMKLNSEAYNMAMYPRFNFRYWANAISDEGTRLLVENVLSKADWVIAVLALVSMFFQKIAWKRVVQLLLVVMILPVNSAEYTGLYLFVGVILFLNEREKVRFDWVYLVLFILILNPFQLIVGGHNMTVLFMNLAASVMLVALTAQSLWAGYRHMLACISQRQECSSIPPEVVS